MLAMDLGRTDTEIATLTARVEELTAALAKCAASLQMVLALDMLEPGEELTEVVAASLREARKQLR
jgi:hypothetical protein